MKKLILLIFLLSGPVLASSYFQLDDIYKTTVDLSKVYMTQKSGKEYIDLKMDRYNYSFPYHSEYDRDKAYDRLQSALFKHGYEECVKHGGGKACEVRK